MRWVNTLTCSVCGGYSENHHIKGHGQGGSLRASDLFTMPLCRDHHSELHRGVMTWEGKHGLQWAYVGQTLAKALRLGKIDKERLHAEIELRIINKDDARRLMEWIT